MIALVLALALQATPHLDIQHPLKDRHAAWVAEIERVMTDGEAYRRQIGLDGDWWEWCEAERKAKEDSFPKDGWVPLGVAQWDALPDDQFQTALYGLERWQKNQQRLCFADVKARLRAANPGPGR